jgi:hypothetical protein
VSLVGVVTVVTSAITGAVVSLVSVVLSVLLEPSSLLLLQEMKVKLKRKRERMMRVCLTWFPIGVLGEHNIYQNLVCFTRMWEVFQFLSAVEISEPQIKESLGNINCLYF